MKRHGQLMGQIAEAENLRLAFWKAAKGKRGKADCLAFREQLEENLAVLGAELLAGEVSVGDYCRAANRNNNNPTNRNNNIGFRSVLPPAQPGCRTAVGLTRPPSCPRQQFCRGKDASKNRPVPVGWRSQSKTPGGPAERCRPSSRGNSPCGKPATSDACPSGDASGLGPP